MGKQENFINFNFDVSAYRLLGRELITDRVTALFEIVKNAYDANANRVEVDFINISPLSPKSKIIIKDDGMGMNLSDLETKWMVIGTSSKRRDRLSPAPYNRKVVGKKGIGRFAVDLLGSKLTLTTKKERAKAWTNLETDWSKYSALETHQLTLPFDEKKDFFTDIKNRYWYVEGEEKEHGTILLIEDVNVEWTEYDVARAYKELSKLVSPNHIKSKYPFRIDIKSKYPKYNDVSVKPLSVIDFATVSLEVDFNKETGIQDYLICEGGKIVKREMAEPIFGFVKFSLYYFDQAAKRKFKDQYNVDIDGIKLYRDGLITTPFAEYEADQNKQKDIIGIDKRRYSGFFDKLNSRDLLGYLEITDENNPNIIETTNRQDFIDNAEWRELKLFIIDHIVQIEKLLKSSREAVRKTTKSDFGKANDELKNIKQSISTAKKDASPEVRKQLQTIESSIGKLQGTVNKSIKDYAKLEEESKQKESLFFSLVSLQTYAAMFSHMTKHTIGHVIRDAEYFKKHFPNEKLNDRFKLISSRVFDEFVTLRTGVDFMLKYAQSDNQIEEINLHSLIKNLFENIYLDAFQKSKVTALLDLKDSLILNYNKKALEDIFDNLISNSLKALKGVTNRERIIKCSGVFEKNELTLYFSDNGTGILDEDKIRIFDIFFTRTAEDGGAGIGLYMVKTRIESMNGHIEVVENEFKPSGATFKLTLPFKK